MTNIWLKFRIWTKVVLFILVAIYALLFFINNTGKVVSPWIFFGREPATPLLLLIFLTFAIGVIGTLLVRTTLKTIRQVRELRERSRSEKIERELADMKSKAAMLQTRREPPPAASEPRSGT